MPAVGRSAPLLENSVWSRPALAVPTALPPDPCPLLHPFHPLSCPHHPVPDEVYSPGNTAATEAQVSRPSSNLVPPVSHFEALEFSRVLGFQYSSQGRRWKRRRGHPKYGDEHCSSDVVMAEEVIPSATCALGATLSPRHGQRSPSGNFLSPTTQTHSPHVVGPDAYRQHIESSYQQGGGVDRVPGIHWTGCTCYQLDYMSQQLERRGRGAAKRGCSLATMCRSTTSRRCSTHMLCPCNSGSIWLIRTLYLTGSFN
jgi:hypothetical protein